MPTDPPTLHLLCGKIASGKSTLAARLSAEPGAVLVAEDDWLDALFADELKALQDYVRCSAKLRGAMGPHVAKLLGAGVSVVLDFAANTVAQRAWMREILASTEAAHRLHWFDVPDEVCLARLHARNASGEHPFVVTDEQFRRVSSHFVPPTADEGFEIVVHSAPDTPETRV